MKNLYFGSHWAGREPTLLRAPALLCSRCDEPIEEGESGVVMALVDEYVSCIAYHHECQARTVLGSLGHQLKRCSCYGGTEEDPEGMTPRQAARAALAYATYGIVLTRCDICHQVGQHKMGCPNRWKAGGDQV